MLNYNGSDSYFSDELILPFNTAYKATLSAGFCSDEDGETIKKDILSLVVYAKKNIFDWYVINSKDLILHFDTIISITSQPLAGELLEAYDALKCLDTNTEYQSLLPNLSFFSCPQSILAKPQDTNKKSPPEFHHNERKLRKDFFENQAKRRIQLAELELTTKVRLSDLSPEALALNALKQSEAQEIIHDDRIIAMGGFYRSLQFAVPSAFALVASRVAAVIANSTACVETHLNAPIDSEVPMAFLKNACMLIRHLGGKSAWQAIEARAVPVVSAAWRVLSIDGATTENIAFEKALLVGDEATQEKLNDYKKLLTTEPVAARKLAKIEMEKKINKLFFDSGAATQQIAAAKMQFDGVINPLIDALHNTPLEARTLSRLMKSSESKSNPWSLAICHFLGVELGGTVKQATIRSEKIAWRYHLVVLHGHWQNTSTQISQVKTKVEADALIKNITEKTREWVASLPQESQANISRQLSTLPDMIQWAPSGGLLPATSDARSHNASDAAVQEFSF